MLLRPAVTVLLCLLALALARIGVAQSEGSTAAEPAVDADGAAALAALDRLNRFALMVTGAEMDSDVPAPILDPDAAQGERDRWTLLVPETTVTLVSGHRRTQAQQTWQAEALAGGWWRLTRQGQRERLAPVAGASGATVLLSDAITMTALIDDHGRLRRYQGDGGPELVRSTAGYRERTRRVSLDYRFAYPRAGAMDMDFSLSRDGTQVEGSAPNTPQSRSTASLRLRGLSTGAAPELFAMLTLLSTQLDLAGPSDTARQAAMLQRLAEHLRRRQGLLAGDLDLRAEAGEQAVAVAMRVRDPGRADATLTYRQTISRAGSTTTEVISLHGTTAAELLEAGAEMLRRQPERGALDGLLLGLGQAIRQGPVSLTLHEFDDVTTQGRVRAVAGTAADGTPVLTAVRTGERPLAEVLANSLVQAYVVGIESNQDWVAALERLAAPGTTAAGETASVWRVDAVRDDQGQAILRVNGTPLFGEQ